MVDEDEVENLETWRMQRNLKLPSGREIYDLAWSPDGRYIISGCFDYVARIWDTYDGMLEANASMQPPLYILISYFSL